MNTPTNQGSTPLLLAIRQGTHDCVRELLQADGIIANAADTIEAATPLMAAAQLADPIVVGLLLRHLQVSDTRADESPLCATTAHACTTGGKQEGPEPLAPAPGSIVKRRGTLVGSVTDAAPDSPAPLQHQPSLPKWIASRLGRTGNLRLLEWTVNQKSRYGVTALMFA